MTKRGHRAHQVGFTFHRDEDERHVWQVELDGQFVGMCRRTGKLWMFEGDLRKRMELERLASMDVPATMVECSLRGIKQRLRRLDPRTAAQ